MQAAITLENVSKKFNGNPAVDKLSFEVKQGDIYGFLGPNGSGKSTTLRMIMSLIKPDEGSIHLFGESLVSNRSSIMRKIGCIIEKPDFYGYLSALENLKLFARANLLQLNEKDYTNLLAQVGLSGRGKDKVKTYSHGMKQRLGLAQVLIHDPELIILDEPNTGLDPQGIIDLRELLWSLNVEQGKTILFSSHILSEVQEICNRMIIIHHGKTVVQGSVEELLSTENLQVSMEVSNPEICKQQLQQSRWQAFLQSEDEHRFSFGMAKTEIPLLIEYLTHHKVFIERIDYKNQLEDYFLKITKGS